MKPAPSPARSPLLREGDRLTQEEFHRRYEAYPEDVKSAFSSWRRRFSSCATRLPSSREKSLDPPSPPAAWKRRLPSLRLPTEKKGVSPKLVILSDGAPQFDILVHALCWVHAERPLARMLPFNDKHRAAIEQVREQIWELYKDLKAYRTQPDAEKKASLEARFDTLVGQQTDFSTSIGGVLKEMREHKEELLAVLERPEVPLHNNGRESDIRGYVKVRKISGGTRSDAGRRCRDTFASLRKTCRKLGVSFWAYLRDRVRGLGQVPRLAELIRTKAMELAAGKAQAATPTAIGGGAAGCGKRATDASGGATKEALGRRVGGARCTVPCRD